jgi:pteridine reductase
MNLRQSTALVTGGAVRIGRAICEALAAQGCGVIVHHDRSAAEAEALCQSIRRSGGQAWPLGRRPQHERHCESLLHDAAALTGEPAILVNNASVFHCTPLADADEASFMTELSINALVPIFLTRALARRLRAAGSRGSVVNLLDRRVAGTEAGCIPYLLSKKMLADFTAAAAVELAPAVAVNAVAPGAILPPPHDDPNRPFVPAGGVPLARPCTPADVAAAVVYLASSEAITGQIVYVDGGQHLVS